MAIPAGFRHPLALIALLAGCAGGPPVPGWQANAAQAMQAFQRLYLAGDTGAAEAEFRLARSELARTGRADLVARAELVRCAVRAASLEFDECSGFERLRDGAGPEELAYADFLAGKGARRTSDDALSRLVGHAVQLRSGAIRPADISAAVDIASAHGWRRPLLAWLGVQVERAEAAGDRDTAVRLRRRMDLISE